MQRARCTHPLARFGGFSRCHSQSSAPASAGPEHIPSSWRWSNCSAALATTWSRSSATPTQVPAWIDAIEGRPSTGRRCWRAIARSSTGPAARSGASCSTRTPTRSCCCRVRDPEEWYQSASNTIFLTFDHLPPEMAPWMNARAQAAARPVQRRVRRPDSDDGRVRAPQRGGRAPRCPRRNCSSGNPPMAGTPICARLDLPVPAEPFPVTNTTDEFRTMIGMPALGSSTRAVSHPSVRPRTRRDRQHDRLSVDGRQRPRPKRPRSVRPRNLRRQGRRRHRR